MKYSLILAQQSPTGHVATLSSAVAKSLHSGTSGSFSSSPFSFFLWPQLKHFNPVLVVSAAFVVGSGGIGSSLLHFSLSQKQISMSVTVTLLSLWFGRLAFSTLKQSFGWSEHRTSCSRLWLISDSQPCLPIVTVLSSLVSSSTWVKYSFMLAQQSPTGHVATLSCPVAKSLHSAVSGSGSTSPVSVFLYPQLKHLMPALVDSDAGVVGSGGRGSSLLQLSLSQKQISISDTVTLLSLWLGRLAFSILKQSFGWSEHRTSCSRLWFTSDSQPCLPIVTVLFSLVSSSILVKYSFILAQQSPTGQLAVLSCPVAKSLHSGVSGRPVISPVSDFLYPQLKHFSPAWVVSSGWFVGWFVGSGGIGSSLLHLSPLQKQTSMSVIEWSPSLWSGRVSRSTLKHSSVCSEQSTSCSLYVLMSVSHPWRPIIIVLFLPDCSSIHM